MRVLLAFALVAVAMGSLRGAASGDDAVSTAPVAMKVDKAQDPFLTRVKSIPTLAKKLDGLEDALADQVRGIAVRNGDSPPPPSPPPRWRRPARVLLRCRPARCVF